MNAILDALNEHPRIRVVRADAESWGAVIRAVVLTDKGKYISAYQITNEVLDIPDEAVQFLTAEFLRLGDKWAARQT